MSAEAFLDTSNVSVVEGDALTLKCRAVGCPVPSISWKFMGSGDSVFVGVGNDVQLHSEAINSVTNESRLIVKNTNRSRGGTYQCLAFNSVQNGKVSSDANAVSVYCT